MTNKEFAKKLEKRTRQFAVRIIKLAQKLPNSPEARVIRTQITEAATSVGANYREANRKPFLLRRRLLFAELEAKQISGTKCKFLKGNVLRHNFGLKS